VFFCSLFYVYNNLAYIINLCTNPRFPLSFAVNRPQANQSSPIHYTPRSEGFYSTHSSHQVCAHLFQSFSSPNIPKKSHQRPSGTIVMTPAFIPSVSPTLGISCSCLIDTDLGAPGSIKVSGIFRDMFSTRFFKIVDYIWNLCCDLKLRGGGMPRSFFVVYFVWCQMII